MTKLHNIKGILVDLEGVLYSDNEIVSGASDVISKLKKNEIKLRFLTNTTTTPRRLIFEKLLNFGFNIEEKEIFTPIIATKNYLRKNSIKRISLITNTEITEEFKEYEITHKNPEVIIMGDIYKNFNWEILDRIFKLVYLNNSDLIALHQNKYCIRDGNTSLDLGPFVKAIEYASGKNSILMGKPDKNFFDLAIANLNIDKSEILMIGDDIRSDIEGSKNAKFAAIQVKTGKYNDKDLIHPIQPDIRINSIVDLPETLGL